MICTVVLTSRCCHVVRSSLFVSSQKAARLFSVRLSGVRVARALRRQPRAKHRQHTTHSRQQSQVHPPWTTIRGALGWALIGVSNAAKLCYMYGASMSHLVISDLGSVGRCIDRCIRAAAWCVLYSCTHPKHTCRSENFVGKGAGKLLQYFIVENNNKPRKHCVVYSVAACT